MRRLINDPDGFNDAGDCILIREDALHVRGDCFACDSEADRRSEGDRCACGEPATRDGLCAEHFCENAEARDFESRAYGRD